MSFGWSRAALTGNTVVAPGLHRISLRVADDVARAFHAPGQYHRVRVEHGKDSMFAIASAPGSHDFEYLIRANDGVAGAWTRKVVGSEVEVSPPEGPGYPLARAVGRTLIIIGTGTGYAPLRSVLQTIRQRRDDFGPVHGLYGVHAPAQIAWADELPALAHVGIHVTPIISRPAPGWTGPVGHVQQHLDRLPAHDAVVFACGQAEMVAEVTERLGHRGVPAHHVFQNYPSS